MWALNLLLKQGQVQCATEVFTIIIIIIITAVVPSMEVTQIFSVINKLKLYYLFFPRFSKYTVVEMILLLNEPCLSNPN